MKIIQLSGNLSELIEYAVISGCLMISSALTEQEQQETIQKIAG